MGNIIESSQPISEVRHNQEVISVTQIPSAIAAITMKATGVLSTDLSNLAAVENGLNASGFYFTGLWGSSSFGSTHRFRRGDLHRHHEGGIIVHKTQAGSGIADFYWAEKDFGIDDPDFHLNPENDELLCQQLGVPISPGSVIVFPSNAWHRFGTNPPTGRHSTFETWEFDKIGAQDS